ncbi:uncharacterized protein LOC134266495 [Saccostrea cucullata]|uniref:uncharacterized protein LOC134266495 n=1 Tax=Saccostrea cuccullata TaxID=36930 RepID=UPI002ED25C36
MKESKVLLLISILIYFSSLTEEAYIAHRGKCPDGYQEGDKWPWGDTCAVCSCYTDHWACESCGVPLRAYNCYLESNTDALYPGCCPQLVCKGDDNFNQTKFTILG